MLPPLRDRVEDIPLLVEHFLHKLSKKLDIAQPAIDANALSMLKRYDWPGNIRELENLLERAINLANMDNDPCISEKHFPTLLDQFAKDEPKDILAELSLNKAIERLEYQMIKKSLQDSNDNKLMAAKILDIHPSVLYRKLKKYSLVNDK
jgi:transcriptional regulator with PAS, ATPase and Fis domain